MNTFVLVLVIPTLLTIVSAGTLYFSFKGRVDISGRYFLLAEFLWLMTLLIVIAINVQPNLVATASSFTLSLVALLSEVAILLSIKALIKKIYVREFIYWIIFVVIYCGFIEYCRHAISPRLPLLLFSVHSLCVTLFTYKACKRINSNNLENNLFLKWIAYTEIALTVIHVLRFMSYFTDTPMMAINPLPLPIIFFSIWISINLIRYFSYLALRVSWVDQRASSNNALNKSLVKLANEKEQFLQGLMSSNRALGISALANSLAHQLSQPITGIILQNESVRRELLNQGNQEKSVQILDTVTEELSKVSALVTNLRRLFGAKETEFKTFNLQEACDEVLEIINPTLHSKNITLIKSFVSSPIVVGNPIQIQQVLINIFNNAIDAIENTKTQDRKINLSISQDQSFAIIVIKDTGNGISPKIVPKMFELYQSTKPDGLGIGLWLCQEIIDKHNGSLTASNELAGGAAFKMRLPLSK
jgi:signal transduction histidine kinase